MILKIYIHVPPVSKAVTGSIVRSHTLPITIAGHLLPFRAPSDVQAKAIVANTWRPFVVVG
jgi:hypothetical protein